MTAAAAVAAGPEAFGAPVHSVAPRAAGDGAPMTAMRTQQSTTVNPGGATR